jgi:hypothetical protein
MERLLTSGVALLGLRSCTPKYMAVVLETIDRCCPISSVWGFNETIFLYRFITLSKYTSSFFIHARSSRGEGGVSIFVSHSIEEAYSSNQISKPSEKRYWKIWAILEVQNTKYVVIEITRIGIEPNPVIRPTVIPSSSIAGVNLKFVLAISTSASWARTQLHTVRVGSLRGGHRVVRSPRCR